MNEPKSRNIGLDILRIFAMLGIIGLHIVNNGGALANVENIANRGAIRLLTVICYSSVDIFAILTGYLYVNKKKYRSVRLIELIGTMLMYSLLITLLFCVVEPKWFGSSIYALFTAIFPPIKGRYWYIVNYSLVFFMIPYSNKLIHGLTKKQFAVLLGILFAALSLLTTVGLYDYFRIQRGYSAFWLLFCYLIGAYIAKNKDDFLRLNIFRADVLYIMSVLSVFGIWMISGRLPPFFKDKVSLLYQYNSPFILMNAVILVLVFSNSFSWLKDKPKIQKGILSLSNSAFSVYLLHSHILIFDNWLKGAFAEIAKLNVFLCMSGVLLGMAGIYVVCWAVDQVKIKLFCRLKIGHVFACLGDWLDKLLDWTDFV